MDFKQALLWLSSVSLVLPTSVWAAIEPQPYVMDSGVAVIPTLTLGYGYDDNLALVKEKDKRESSSYINVDPGVVFLAEQGLNQYMAAYFIRSGRYFSSSVDNYVDHKLHLKTHLDLAVRHRFDLNYQFNDQHEGRGSGLTEGLDITQDVLLRYRTNDLAGLYSYGSLKAMGRIDFMLGWGDQTYTKVKDQTKFWNWQALRYGGTFYYNVSSATALLFELTRAEKRYDVVRDGEASRDNDDHFVYIGATWDITGKTQGTAKFGYENKQFKDSHRQDFDDFSWDIRLSYTPVDYSTLNLITNSYAKDPDQFGDYNQQTKYGADWEHYWLKRLSSQLGYLHTIDDYTGNGARKDNTDKLEISLGYDFMRWLELRAGYKYKDKTSNRDSYGYQQHIFYLNLMGTL